MTKHPLNKLCLRIIIWHGFYRHGTNTPRQIRISRHPIRTIRSSHWYNVIIRDGSWDITGCTIARGDDQRRRQGINNVECGRNRSKRERRETKEIRNDERISM
uniref:Uncharacterized protein n=1 Tax=Cacopsylla melanoneura TaxID=428564 RepID=A0A8D8Q300_9HEMI